MTPQNDHALIVRFNVTVKAKYKSLVGFKRLII